MKKALKRVMPALLALFLISPLVTPARAQEFPGLTQVQSFWGTLICGGVDAPAGTAVTAKVGGVIKGYIVTTVAGWYATEPIGTGELVVQNANFGDTVEFYISNAAGEVKANEPATYQGGGRVTRLNLTSAALPAVAAAPVETPSGVPPSAEEIGKMAPGEAAKAIEKMTPEAAADALEQLTPTMAADIIAQTTTASAAAIIAQVTTATATAIIEQVTTLKATDILQQVAVKPAAAIMQELTIQRLTDVVARMSQTSLLERLPELTVAKLLEIPTAVLFAALPDAPTEQLVNEEPPVPPTGSPSPVIVYETPSGVRYMLIQAAGGWGTIVGSPFPLKKIKIKSSKALEKIETTVNMVTAPPEAAKLPSDTSVASFFEIILGNITPEQMLVGHTNFVVPNTWIEQNKINKWSIFLSRYDKEAGTWVRLPTTKKEETTDSVYYDAITNAFSLFAITGSTTVPVFEFNFTNLSIKPAQPRVGESVTITADVQNERGETDKYVAALWINSTVEDVKYLTLAKGQKTTVSFNVAKNQTGTYDVRIGRQMGSFQVLPALPPSPPVPKPAKFAVSQLGITPAEVKAGEAVTITATVTNSGEAEGTYEAALKIDGVKVESKTVTLGGGKSTKVTFSVTRDAAATYQVEIDGQAGKFTVAPKPAPPPPPPSPKPFPWWWIVAGVVVIALLIFFLVRRRSY